MGYALCKLHNFCIDQWEERFLESSAQDQFAVSINGGFQLDTTQDGFPQPTELLDGSYHNDGAHRHYQQQQELPNPTEVSPRQCIINIVRENNLTRPTPIGWG